jgi:general secretion pathway protein A
MLEQLRLSFSDEMDSQSLATLILVGHPDLRRNLHLSVNEAFAQRLAVHYHLGPLDLQETIDYIKHHVRIAGYTAGPLFTDNAIQRMFEYTKGLTHRINQLCTTAPMDGYDRTNVLQTSNCSKKCLNFDVFRT